MNKARDIAYGRHSAIPPCCIDFFVDEWEQEMNRSSPYYEAVKWSSYNYVPCPRCFAIRRKIKIVDCRYDCGRECWRDFV
jgi:hypothetical protein